MYSELLYVCYTLIISCSQLFVKHLNSLNQANSTSAFGQSEKASAAMLLTSEFILICLISPQPANILLPIESLQFQETHNKRLQFRNAVLSMRVICFLRLRDFNPAPSKAWLPTLYIFEKFMITSVLQFINVFGGISS